MADQVEQLRAVVRGAIQGIKGQTAKERERRPADATANHYNKIRADVAAAVPQVAKNLPPAVAFAQLPAPGPLATYADLLIYYEQVDALLRLNEEPLMPSFG